jgi:hypothetical protein
MSAATQAGTTPAPAPGLWSSIRHFLKHHVSYFWIHLACFLTMSFVGGIAIYIIERGEAAFIDSS